MHFRFTPQLHYALIIVLSFLVLVSACKQEETPKDIPKPVAKPKPAEKPKDTLRFERFALNGFSSLKQLEAGLGLEQMLLVLKVNRLDRKHIRDNDTLAIPNVFDERLSPFPQQLEAAKDISKLLVISRRAQVFAAYDSGMLVRWGPTSTGKKKTPTPAGLYHANWKKDTAISTVDPSWILPWCVNIDNFEGISLHQFDLPGYPASHSCIRLLAEDARWIFHWVETWRLTRDAREVLAYGTPIIVFEEYPFGSPFIRKRIIKNPSEHFVYPKSIDSIIAKYKPVIIDRQIERFSYLSIDKANSINPVVK